MPPAPTPKPTEARPRRRAQLPHLWYLRERRGRHGSLRRASKSPPRMRFATPSSRSRRSRERRPPASPTVRRMARELGVDINQVRGSGSGWAHLIRRRERLRQVDHRGRFERRVQTGGPLSIGPAPTGAAPQRQSPGFLALRRRRAHADAQGARDHRAEHGVRVEHGCARHPARRGRHHACSKPRARNTRRASKRAAASSPRRRSWSRCAPSALEASSRISTPPSTSASRRSSTRSISTSALRSTPSAVCWCRCVRNVDGKNSG